MKQYENGTYEDNKLSFLGFLEPEISYYNKGNVYYQKKEYENAIVCYKDALSHHPSKERECAIRINLALSMIAPLDVSNLSKQDLKQAIATLKEAQKILCENGCATERGNGHSKNAQTLKDDIERFLKELEQMPNASSKSSDDSDEESKDKEEEAFENRDTIEEQLKDIQQQSNNERSQSLSSVEGVSDFEFYNGQTW